MSMAALCVRRQRPPALREQLLPALGVSIFDDRQLLEELFPIAIRFDCGKRTVQIRGIAFVAIVLVPRRIRLWGFGCRAARMRRRLHIHEASIAALLDPW